MKKKNSKEWVLIVGGIVIILVCIAMVGFLLNKSMVEESEIPGYGIAFFSSITTLILGYLFGRGGKH